MCETHRVSDARLADTLNGNLDLDFVLKSHGRLKIARCVDSRPADPALRTVRYNRKPQMPQEFMFGLLHEQKEI